MRRIIFFLKQIANKVNQWYSPLLNGSAIISVLSLGVCLIYFTKCLNEHRNVSTEDSQLLRNRINGIMKMNYEKKAQKIILDTIISLREVSLSDDSIVYIIRHIVEYKYATDTPSEHKYERVFADCFQVDSFLVFVYPPEFPQLMSLDATYNATLKVKTRCLSGNPSGLLLDIDLKNTPDNSFCGVNKERYDHRVMVKDTARWKWHLKPQKKGKSSFVFFIYPYANEPNYKEPQPELPHEIAREAKITSPVLYVVTDFFSKHWPDIVVGVFIAAILASFRLPQKLFQKIRSKRKTQNPNVTYHYVEEESK